MGKELDLELAIRDLGRILGVKTQHDLMRVLFEKATNTNFKDQSIIIENHVEKEDSAAFFELITALLSIMDGGLFIGEFTTKWREFLTNASEEEKERFKKPASIPFTVVGAGSEEGDQNISEIIPSEMATYTMINDSDLASNFPSINGIPSKADPNFGSVQFHNVALNFSNRYSSAAAVFLNALPTIEISRCVPYLDVKVITSSDALDSNNIPIKSANGISLHRFLFGKDVAVNFKEYSSYNLLNQGMPSVTEEEEKQLTGFSAAGMELFTAPQSLVNGDEKYHDLEPDSSTTLNRKTPIIDKNRPFMTLNSFNASVKPTFGLMSTKTGRLSITLHDRSRLAEISELTSPGEFKNIEFLIDFGWSHPDKDSAYGKILNAMRCRQKYVPVSAGFSFDPAGQVQVDIDLISKGTNQMNYTVITDSQSQTLYDKMKEIVHTVNKLKKAVKKEYDSELKDITSGGEMLGKLNSVQSMIGLGTKQLGAIEKAIKNLDKGIDDAKIDSLIKELRNSIGIGEKDNIVQQYKSQVRKAIEKLLKNIDTGEDPYLKQVNGQTEVFPTKEIKVQVDFVRDRLNPEWLKANGKVRSRFNDPRDQRWAKSNADIQARYGDRSKYQIGVFDYGVIVYPYLEQGNLMEPFFYAFPAPGYLFGAGVVRDVEAAPNLIGRNGRTQHAFRFDPPEPFYKPEKFLGRAIYETRTVKLTSRFISIGKILYLFVASSLASTKKFDEIQFLYYPLNAYSSFARNCDVGSFPILKKDFKDLLRKRLEKNPTITLGQFIGFLNKNFFSNLATDVYGFRNLYERDPKTQAGVARKKFREGKNKKKLFIQRADILKAAYENTGQEPKFKKPNISMHLETVNAASDSEKTILRLHFFDSATTSYESYSDIWNSTKSSYLSSIKSSISSNAEKLESLHFEDKPNAANAASAISGHEVLMAQQLKKLEELNLFEAIDDAGGTVDIDQDQVSDQVKAVEKIKYFRVKGGPKAIRNIFARNIPTIKYGTEASAVLNASVSQNADPKMQMVHMQRQGRKESLPGEMVDDGLPLQTFPVSLSMDVFGCPLLNFGQQFFVDFATGTTIDDIYMVNGIEHTLAPGNFQTSITMIPMNRNGEFVSAQAQVTKAVKELEDLKKKYKPAE